MVSLVILPMLPLAYQWYHWLTNDTNCTIDIAIGTNGITNLHLSSVRSVLNVLCINIVVEYN